MNEESFDFEQPTGLDNTPKDEWPSGARIEAGSERPFIERLSNDPKLHGKVREYFASRLRMSEEAMKVFHPRWRVQEKKAQAYIDLPNWEKTLKEMNDTGAPPKAVRFVVPYTYATISTIVTYLFHTFAGRKPMFQVNSYKNETVHSARMMELVMQYNADHTRMMKCMFQFLQDGELYGLQAMRTRWKEERKLRTVWKKQPKFGFMSLLLGTESVKTKEERLVYAGNEVANIDPFLFFPDTRVPMSEVATKGEFVIWRSYEGKHGLKVAEADGEFFNIDKCGVAPAVNWTGTDSARGLLSGGDAHAGDPQKSAQINNFIQVDQGSFTVIPRELEISGKEKPEKWMFALGNKRQIIQAEPMDADHDMHPVVVGEPYSLGYGLGQPGISDFTAPMQDIMSWLVNSHIENVRTALNNMLVVDPGLVEMQDLKNPGPGKIIRLKEAAQGTDVRAAVQQLGIVDVTSGHMHRDFPMVMKIADAIGAVNDNLRGIQNQGGRKSATEARTSAEAAASRLASHAKLISSQSMVVLAEQLSLNIQQYLDDEFFIDIVGMQGLQYPLRHFGINPAKLMAEGGAVRITPEMLVGDFYYPVHDGTLPMDKVALLDAWTQMFQTIQANPLLMQRFDIVRIFEFIGQLSGAQNIGEFKIDLMAQPDAQVAAQAQAGNIAPMGGAGGPQTPGA